MYNLVFFRIAAFFYLPFSREFALHRLAAGRNSIKSFQTLFSASFSAEQTKLPRVCPSKQISVRKEQRNRQKTSDKCQFLAKISTLCRSADIFARAECPLNLSNFILRRPPPAVLPDYAGYFTFVSICCVIRKSSSAGRCGRFGLPAQQGQAG